MKKQSLEKILAALYELRQTMHDDANVGITEQLNEAIRLVEECLKERDSDAIERAMSSLGRFLIALPSIQKLLEKFLE